MRIVGHNISVDFYTNVLIARMAQAQKIPSLEEFMELSSNKPEVKEPEFDDATDKFLEAEAMKRLQQRGLSV